MGFEPETMRPMLGLNPRGAENRPLGERAISWSSGQSPLRIAHVELLLFAGSCQYSTSLISSVNVRARHT